MAVKNLTGKVAVITGGASGIGYAIAQRMAREGMQLVLADIEQGALDAAVGQLTAAGAQVIGVPTDVASWSSVEQLAARAEDAFGLVHVICNNAGVERLGIPAWETPLQLWEWILNVDLWGVIHGVKAFVPGMVERGEGHVVNTSSLAGLVVSPYHAPYTSAKHAVIGISESLYHELRGRGINVGVSVVCPAMVQSNILDADRNWRSEDGELPAQGAYQDEAKSRMPDAAPASIVADDVVDAIRTNRFWVLPSGDADKVHRRFASVGTPEGPGELWRASQRGERVDG
jgi:NAD(P)-dependent dehydrogenase (short-subunit alcohol dehydrogenase family)